MLNKKIMIVLLALGALVIIALLGVSYQLSSKIRAELELTLNDHLSQAVNTYTQRGLNISYAPFVCLGMSSYQCISKHITLIDSHTGEEVAKVAGLALHIDEIQTGSMQISLGADHLSFSGIQKAIQESKNQELLDLYTVLMPESFVCHEKDIVSDKHSGAVSSQRQCTFKAQGIQYRYSFDGRVKSPDFADKTILNAMISYYGSLSLLDKLSSGELQADFAIDHIAFVLTSSHLKDTLYPILEADYRQHHPKTKIPFDTKAYHQALENIRGFIDFGLTFSGLGVGPYAYGLQQFFDGIVAMAEGEVSEVSIQLIPKNNPAPYFSLTPDTISNLTKLGTQQRLLAKVFNHYNLQVSTQALKAPDKPAKPSKSDKSDTTH
ncbi:hypothetical protein BKH46_05365 [Helicobacter sp. 12S02634-8]|uniref:hypothetical protein n=1 Tax=Helicobacter sp. 12S02634-8 TaxID=1476199 RepID=UPI000BA6C756|nr:hypothetical protein [Helicobacter sp. 12S02634-8]PAF47137.1 hypothetical protein BKH46_05365 [Helicobacter sp. 12S02634-8]